MTREPIAVIGLGPAGPAELAPAARTHLEGARVLAGGKRLLEHFPAFAGERIVIDADLGNVLARLADVAQSHKTVVLASGDPLFFGIGRALLAAFPKEDLLFFPHLSSVQLAFARLKETWHDACVISLHGRPLHTLRAALQRGEPKMAVLTDPTNNPQAIAGLLEATGVADRYAFWVCEELGGPAERITEISVRHLPETPFSPLSVVVLLRRGSTRPGAGLTPVLGLPDDTLRHRADLITKREVRLLSLCQLALRPGDVCWDLGAGSGSVAIEAARLSPQLTFYAVEKDAQAWQELQANVISFGLTNVQAIYGEAPEALAALPDPDAVFIGGSGGRLAELLATALVRLQPGGRLVVNCITLENLALSWALLRERDAAPEVLSVQLAHSRPLGSLHCLEPEHPISILKATKP